MPSNPTAIVSLNHCTISECDATGNGGGLYCTIKGQMNITGATLVESCEAIDGGANPQYEGLGGGICCSAGGKVCISGGSSLQGNVAYSSGGGLSVKSADALLSETVSISDNHANGDSTAGWGNGGGIYVTTSRFDGMAVELAAALYNNEGHLTSDSSGVTIEGNTASRWGSGVYVGASWSTWSSPYVHFCNATVQSNTRGKSIMYYETELWPSQIAAEYATYCPSDPTTFNATLNFDHTIVRGSGTPPVRDIGEYHWSSNDDLGAIQVDDSIFIPSLSQP